MDFSILIGVLSTVALVIFYFVMVFIFLVGTTDGTSKHYLRKSIIFLVFTVMMYGLLDSIWSYLL